MLQLSDKAIRAIVGDLDMGMKCFYHLHTGALVSIPDDTQFGDLSDDDIWGAEIKKVEANPADYLAFTPMESWESYEVMQDFVMAIPEDRLRIRFEDVIQRKKPFQQFKDALFDYPHLREQWFVFKEQRYIQYVRNQVDGYNLRTNDSPED